MMRRVLSARCGVLVLTTGMAPMAVCGTTGIDGPVNVAQTTNRYYPASGIVALASGSTSVTLAAIPAADAFGNNFGTSPIAAGDLLLIHQVQDADIDITNSDLYGSASATAGPDGLGGTGYTALNNTGRHEFLVATNAVPLTGGTLTFRGGGSGSGTVHAYASRDGTSTLTQKRFQVVRVPQFSDLTLTSDLTCPPWNGRGGGIIAFDVAGQFDFNGYSISANGRGFRAGYQDIAGSGSNLRDLYVTATYDQASGKGENIAGTPQYMWDGFNAVDNGTSWNGFSGGDYGEGAPGNGGGGGNDHNAGGGGGSNGGAGGVGGTGWEGGGGNWPNGVRPGIALARSPGRLFLGGGGDANNALTGVKGGIGGGLVVINAGRISGSGTIMANVDNGDVGAYGSAPDGAGGGGAGGTIFLNITQNSPSAVLSLSALGGSGWNTLNDPGFEHGPGGGGGGGSIWYNASGATVSTNMLKGSACKSNGGAGIVHGAANGQDGAAASFVFASLPTYRQWQSSTCYPALQVIKTSHSAQNSVGVPQGANTNYTLTLSNSAAAGNAGGVRVEDFLPAGFTFVSAVPAYAGGAAGPGTLTNLGTATQPIFGDFNIPNGGVVTLTVGSSVSPGTYHNGAQVSWLDPSRTLANPSRRIVPATNSYTGATATYEVGGAAAAGSNYSNAPGGPVGENVLVLSYPVAGDDAFTMNEDGTLADQNVKANDSDGDDVVGNITWNLLSGGTAAANGTLGVNANGTFSYTPNTGFNGTVAFAYQVCDGDGLCDEALVIISVGAMNDPPDVNDDVVTTNEETPVTAQVLANDSDSDGDLVEGTVIITMTPGHGAAVVNVDGSITYTPDPDYSGPDALQYQVCDDGAPLPAQCGTAFLDINVLPLDDAPRPFNDGFSFLEDGGTFNGDVAGNDHDVDDANSTLTWSLVSGGSAEANGTLVLNGDGTFNFAPAPDHNGFVVFTYRLCDPGGSCTEAAVGIDVLPVNDPPVASGDLDNTPPDVPLTTNVSANDHDTTDGSTIDIGSITIIVPPDSGAVVVNGNGTVTYAPNAGFIGNDTVVYQICDIGVPAPALCDTAILVVEVSLAYPLAIDDGLNLPEDSLVVMDVLENDTTFSGVLDPATVMVINGPLQGTATVNPDGTITYAPDPDHYGPDAFNYTVCTDAGLCSNATVLLHVDPVNDPPEAANDTLATDEDSAIAFSVVSNDTDLRDGSSGGVDSLTLTITVPPGQGTAAVDVDGTIIYTPATDFNGMDSVKYRVCDVGYPLPAECDTAWVIITVGQVGDPPVITDGGGSPIDTMSVTTDEDVPLTICFNAVDPESDTLDATNSFLGPDFGVITGEADGDTCITYTPDPDYNGGDTVTVVVCDNAGLCDTVVVVIAVLPVNDPPQVVDVIGDPTDTVTTTTPEDTPITICSDAVDIDGDPVEVSGVTAGPQNGSATGLADGDTCWTYTPDPDFNGTDTVTVLVCDDHGGCDTVTVVIEVTPVNDDPVITDGTGSPVDTLNVYTLENIPVTVCLAGTDIDGGALDVTGVPDGPFNGTVTGLQDGDTCITYAPDPDFLGSDTLVAVLTDGAGGADTVVVIITVLETNDPPIIVETGTPIDTVNVTTPEDISLQICLDAIDPEGSPVDVVWIAPLALTGSISGLSDGDTCLTYTPFQDHDGTDSLYVLVCDGFNACDSVLLIITVTPVNDPPVITDGVFTPIDTVHVAAQQDIPVAICLTALDADGDTLDVMAVLNGPLNGLADSFGDGDTCLTYTPDPGYFGGDTLTAVVCDPGGACDTVLVIMDVAGPNNPPVIVDENQADTDTLVFTTPEDTPTVICIGAIDPDGDALDVTSVFGGPLFGFVNGIADGDTCFTYTPVPDWSGADTLNAIVCDGNGGCDTAVVIINITPVNDPPIVVDGGAPIDTLNTSTPEGIPLTICLEATDADGDTLDVTAVTHDGQNGTTGGMADGDTCFTYSPDPAFIGPDTVTVVVCDNAGACDTVTVIIDVTPLNPNGSPIAVDDTASTAAGVSVTVHILDNDSDPDGDPLTVSSTNALHGTVTINGDGTIVYTPDSGFCGTDTIVYTVCDPFLACDDAIVVVQVSCPPVNDPPIAVDDTVSTTVNESVTVTVLGNDSDPDGDPITVTSASAGNGTVTINGDGTITYTPDPLFCGTDTILYTICDPGPLCDDAIVVVEIPCPPVNDPPIAVDDSAFVDPDSDIQVAIVVLANDTDPNGDPLTVTSADAANGSVGIGQNGELYYSAYGGFCGTDTITYTVCDPEPLCDEAYVFVTVECPDTVELAIPEGFTPNNDGYGDRWVIRGLERYPLAKVTIFNRWGNEVYGADPYHNDWDGRSTDAFTWDGVLPVGTYWYLLDLGLEGEEVRSGYIYLNR